MRFLVYTDLQATEGSDRCFVDPSLPLQRYRVKRFFGFLAKVFNDEQCDAIIDLGDTTDDRSYIPRATLDSLLGGLSQFAPNSNGIKLTGNHEQLIKYADVNSKHLFQPYFGAVDPETILLDEKVEAVCHPFHEDYDAVNATIEKRLAGLRPESFKVLLAHGDVCGVRYDSGEACKKGIDPKLVERFDLALLGHVHRHQKISRNAYYVGSPFQQDFGEAAQRKFVVVFDTEHPKTLKWITVEGMPEYRVVDLKDFVSKASPTEEHRYWVTLNSIEETEQFYADPKSILGQAKLTYTAKLAESAKADSEALSDRQLLERYAATRPISGVPDEVAKDLVEIGEMLLK
jgi:DNA repair exonuclease SbcCD nuclease subunit